MTRRNGRSSTKRDRGAGDELADRLHALQARHRGAGRAVLEVRQGQPEEVAEHLRARAPRRRGCRCAARGIGASRSSPALKTRNMPSPMAMAMSVLCVWCTTTLSITTWVKSGVARPTIWMAAEASSTSRQMARWRASSGTNQRKPNARLSPSASSGAGAPARRAAPVGSKRSANSPRASVRGAFSPARK